jgi:hypothetical protein
MILAHPKVSQSAVPLNSMYVTLGILPPPQATLMGTRAKAIICRGHSLLFLLASSESALLGHDGIESRKT